MSDFSIDSLEEYERKEEQQRKRSVDRSVAVFLVFFISLTIGFLIYFILNYYMNSSDNRDKGLTPIEVNNSDVRTLYSYVTYGTRGVRNNKFLFSNTVTMSSFSDSEKFYYASQFIRPDDFVYTNEKNSYSQKIYTLSDDKIRTYMVRFFGSNVTYSNNMNLSIIFPFNMNKMNVAKMTYNVKRRGFDVVFHKHIQDEAYNPANTTYYTLLDSAFRKEDGTIIIREKVIYASVAEIDGYFTVSLYKDFLHQELIDQKMNLSANQVYNLIDWNLYPNAAYIEYTFPLSGVVYYFQSSQFVNE